MKSSYVVLSRFSLSLQNAAAFLSGFSVINSKKSDNDILYIYRLDQKKIDISYENIKVECLENSHFLNNSGIAQERRSHFQDINSKLLMKLKTSQFNWYLAEENKTKK